MYDTETIARHLKAGVAQTWANLTTSGAAKAYEARYQAAAAKMASDQTDKAFPPAGFTAVSTNRHGWITSCENRFPIAAVDIAILVAITKGTRCAVSANHGIRANYSGARHDEGSDAAPVISDRTKNKRENEVIAAPPGCRFARPHPADDVPRRLPDR